MLQPDLAEKIVKEVQKLIDEEIIVVNTEGYDGKTNVVGRIKEEEIFLLDYLQPWDKFAFQN